MSAVALGIAGKMAAGAIALATCGSGGATVAGYNSAHKSEAACAVSGGRVYSNGCEWPKWVSSATVDACMDAIDIAWDIPYTVEFITDLAASCGAGRHPEIRYGWLLD